jgi:hypothetical protein
LGKAIVRDLSIKNASHILWDGVDQPKVYVTGNFWRTIAQRPHDKLDLHLREVNFLLIFEDSHVLLLSNGEADVISELMWKAQRDGTKVSSGPTLMPFHVLRAHTVPSEGNRPSTPSLLQPFGAATHPERVPAMSVAQLLLFNGDTQFGGSLRTSLKQMLPSQVARKAALLFPAIRGTNNKLERSDLEAACNAQGMVTGIFSGHAGALLGTTNAFAPSADAMPSTMPTPATTGEAPSFWATPLQEQGATAPLLFQVITAMSQYSAKSVEELRYEVCRFHPHAHCCVST